MTIPDVIDDDELPRPFGPYLLLQNFARGGMGDVYLAKSGGIAGLERTCVVKKLRAELTGDREYVTRFVDEARVVVTLNHANICNVFDVGRVASVTSNGPVEEYYLAMEYVSGRDLRTVQDRCRKRGLKTDPVTVVHLVCEVLKALDYAHRRRHPVSGEPLNLVHRDISPQNVLVSFEGEVKLIDFGLAASRLKVERTQPNVVMGKMAYMAPEQARGDVIDSRADLFACGVILYEFLVNERYYEGMTPNDIWQVAGRGSFVPRGWHSIDPVLQGILGRALHPDPSKRIATCGELREQLLSWMASRQSAGAERVLRELMESLFVDEIVREQATMARFGSVTIASFTGKLESGGSSAITLAHGGSADDASVVDPRPRVSDRTTEEGPPPPASSSSPLVGNHDDPTRLQQRPEAFRERQGRGIHDEKTVVTNSSGRTLAAQEASERNARRARAERAEPTQMVRAARRGAAAVDDLDDVTDGIPGDTTSMERPRQRHLRTVGAIAVGALVAWLIAVAIGPDEDDSKARGMPPATASQTAPLVPTTLPTTTAPTTLPTTTLATTTTPTTPPTTTTLTTAPAKPVATTTPPPTAAKPVKTTVDPRPASTKPPPPPTPTPTPPAVAATVRMPAVTSSPVTTRDWNALQRKHFGAPCVVKLMEQRTMKFMSEPQLLLEHASAIRQCAASLGFPMDG